VITTFAGGGIGDGGPGSAAALRGAEGVFLDPSGAVYVADTENHRVRMVDSLGVITTVVGTGVSGFSGDGGAGTDAQLDSPADVFVDATGWLYVADTGNDRVRVVDAQGVVTTMAGGGTGIGEGGPATAAGLSGPAGVFVDSLGVLYVADTGNHRIRKIDPSRTIITTAGTGSAGLSGDGGSATAASLDGPRGLYATGDGSLYFADSGNHRIRKVDPSGVITTVAGKTGRGFAGDGGLASEAALDTPSGLIVGPSGNLYVADAGNNRIRKVSETGEISSMVGAGPVGSYTDAFFGDGGPAAAAGLDSPSGIFVGASGYVLVCDTDNDRVRRIDPLTGTIATVVGDGTGAYGGDGIPATETSINGPRGAFVDGLGNLYIADTANHRVRRVDASDKITTEVGTGTDGYLGDGRAAEAARLNLPTSVFVDRAGNLYVSDYNNNRIRKVDAKSGVISTVAGSGTIGPLGGTFAGDGGAATVARLNQPSAVFVDRFGDLYIADTLNNRIRKVDAKSGVISTVAGNGIIGYSGDGGAATAASLNIPQGVFVDDGGYLFIADAGNNRVRRVDTSGMITTVAGSGTAGYSGDGGEATVAMLDNPTGVYVDGSGHLYVVDTGNSRIRRVESAASPTLLAVGSFTYPDETILPDVIASWPVDGAQNIDPEVIERRGTVMIFNKVIDVDTLQIAVSAGTQTANWRAEWEDGFTRLILKPLTGDPVAFGTEYRMVLSRVRDAAGNTTPEITVAFTTLEGADEEVEENIETLGGDGTAGFAGDGGPASEMQVDTPSDVSVDSLGNVYVADTGNNRIRKINASGNASTVAGDGGDGF
jgi:sugar lactone lactonase YvrE